MRARRALALVCTRPAWFVPAAVVVTLTGLGLDHFAPLGWQMALGACTWVILLAVMWHLRPHERAQTIIVVGVATCAELIGSVLWGIYTYRLGNLPLFVPPGHGLVYLTGLRISQSGPIRAHPRVFIAIVMGLVGTWALLGLSVLPRLDVAGAVGATVLCVFLFRGRAPTVYAGVFLAVAVLELYGTAVGTWRWHEAVPGLGVPDGNPPSGAASGYVFFDIAALALAPRLMAAMAAARARRVLWGRPAAAAPTAD